MIKRNYSCFNLLFLAIAISFLCSCNQENRSGNIRKKQTASPVSPTKPVAAPAKIVIIQPLGSEASVKEATAIYRQFKLILPSIKLAPVRPLPGFAYYKPMNRYRADSLISWMGRIAGKNETWLGITTTDISTTHRGKSDWGVMGLGFHPGNACVASSYRMKDKTHFWKVAIHELGHTVGLPHCPVKSCFMRDAEKRNPTAEETAFCPSCKARLKQAGWKL